MSDWDDAIETAARHLYTVFAGHSQKRGAAQWRLLAEEKRAAWRRVAVYHLRRMTFRLQRLAQPVVRPVPLHKD